MAYAKDIFYLFFLFFHFQPGSKGTCFALGLVVWHLKVSKGAKIKNRYNQVPHLTQDTNGKVTNTQLYTTNESQEVSPFPAGNHKVQRNRRNKGITNTLQQKNT